MTISGLKHCRFCGDVAAFDRYNKQRADLCDSDECHRLANNEYQRKWRHRNAEPAEPTGWAALSAEQQGRYWRGCGVAVLDINSAFRHALHTINDRLRLRRPELFRTATDCPPGPEQDWLEETAQGRAIELEYARWEEFERMIVDTGEIMPPDDWDGMLAKLDIAA